MNDGKLTRLTHAEWLAEGARRFGPDPIKWRFVCPSCNHVAAAEDWKAAGASAGAVGFSCLGRFTGDPKKAHDNTFMRSGGPCNYTGGGLFRMNPVTITFEDGSTQTAFDFAPTETIGQSEG